MAIKKIKLPDNTTEDINDPRLPAVTATDNGKVLSVSGGIWSANSKPSYTLDEVSDGSTRKLSDYVTIDGTETITGKKTFTGAIMSIKYDNPRIGFYTSAGTLNGVIAYRDTVGPEIYTGSEWNRMYHSGNSNKSDVAWACSTLTASGDITVRGSAASVHMGEVGSEAIVLRRNSLGVSLGAGTYGSLATIIYGSPIRFYTHNGTSGVEQMRLFANGNLHLGGTTATSYKLQVTGNIFATGTITPGSDSRIKDNQQDINTEDAFFIIERLQPKTWIWNEKADKRSKGKSAAGLVAQEVKEVLPEAVEISENGDIKDFHSLNYNTIQGYEIAAIKGLIEEVKSLKAEIAELKKQIK